MSDFRPAVEYVLGNEGTLDNDPDDPGGVTHYGITLVVLREMGELGDLDHDGDVDVADIRKMTREEAIEVYRARWWDQYHYERLMNQTLATKVMDLAVNLGPKQGHLILQRGINATDGTIGLAEDGILGPQTCKWANLLGRQALLGEMMREACMTYGRIIQKHPELGKYIVGWLARAFRLPEPVPVRDDPADRGGEGELEGCPAGFGMRSSWWILRWAS